MRIVKDHPPNFSSICAYFPEVLTKKGIAYCWGSLIFSPDNSDLPEWIVAHEEVHSKQQGEDIKGWWEKYYISHEFRLEQELPAHVKEVKVYSEQHKDRNDRNRYLVSAARRISSPLYGSIVSYRNAADLLRKA